MEQTFQGLKKLGHQKKKPMKIFKYSLCGLFTATFFLAACGDDVTNVTKETSGLEVVSSADSLGKCSEEIAGEMKFVSKENAVFVCADSAWKNVSDAGKALCSTEILTDSSGYKIVCGGDSVGVVFNGKDGAKGADGNSCTVSKIEKSESFVVICGSDTVGTLKNGLDGMGCSTTDNGDGSFTQVCGKDTVTLYKAICGDSYYDPDNQLCYADSVYSFCDGKFYSPKETFCFGNSLYALCGGKIYDPQNETCENGNAYGSVTDVRDGQVYKTVRIGKQNWMAQNLNYAYMPDTSSFCYDNSADSCAKYGRLYTWAAAMDSAARFGENGKDCGFGTTCSPKYPVRGVCMKGWHMPDTTEWNALIEEIGCADSLGYALKSASDWNGSDSFGFGALPAGFRSYSGYFRAVRDAAEFWASTEFGLSYVYELFLSYNDGLVDGYKENAISVRCIKDE